jgi:iron(III) transport system substrate-binding protein
MPALLRSGFLTAVLSLALFAAGAASAGEVVLYSSNQPELLDMVAQGFEKKTGHKVSVVRMGTGEAMKRIQAEKENPLADVFWSGDVAVLENAKKNFAPTSRRRRRPAQALIWKGRAVDQRATPTS